MRLSRLLTTLVQLAALLSLCLRTTAAQLPDSSVTRAVAGLSEFANLCGEPAAALWHASLCGPVVLVDPESRAAIANRRPAAGSFAEQAGMYVGTLPADVVVANTATSWAGQSWTMVMLPLPKDQFDRVRLLAHESFHRIQPQLGVPALNVVIPELEERDARYWLRLELRALVAVQLDSGTSRARTALGDALLFGAVRHRQFPGTDSLESALELSEGLAEYTGVVVAARVRDATMYRAADWARRNLESLPTFARSYGYGAGPPLGLALDRFAPGWRDRIGTIRSLSAELEHAAGWVPPLALLDSARARAVAYDAAAIAAEEDARWAVRTAQVAAYRKSLIDGPVVVFRQRGLGGGFNPNTIFPLGDAGLVYPSRTVFADWGQLTVASGGLLVSNDRSVAIVTAARFHFDSAAGIATGDGWELKLARGWALKQGVRAGDFEVVRLAPPND